MCVCFSHNAKHVYFEVISFVNSKDILPPITHYAQCDMFNLHIKQTEISQERSKETKNEKDVTLSF